APPPVRPAVRPHALLRRRPRSGALRGRVPRGRRREHPVQPAVRGPRDRPVLHARPVRLRRGGPAARRAGARLLRGRDGARHDLHAGRRGHAAADPHPGQQVRPLPQRPAVPAPDGHPQHRDPARGVQPPRLRRPRRLGRHPLRPPAGHPGHQGRGRGGDAAAGRRARRRAGGAGPLHAGADRADQPRAGRSGDQHPPLVPAQLQGREALPPGARPRYEADRRDRPLRQRRPRRGPHHRA
ncbi:MAG: Formyltetrahydrofolate deformylase, partial [uncultured Friedmanniella sp.]